MALAICIASGEDVKFSLLQISDINGQLQKFQVPITYVSWTCIA